MSLVIQNLAFKHEPPGDDVGWGCRRGAGFRERTLAGTQGYVLLSSPFTDEGTQAPESPSCRVEIRARESECRVGMAEAPVGEFPSILHISPVVAEQRTVQSSRASVCLANYFLRVDSQEENYGVKGQDCL